MKITDSYHLKIIDQLTAPLNGILKQAEKVNATMERMEQLAQGGLGLLKLGGAVGVALGGLKLLGSGLSAVLGLLEKGAELAWGFGRAIVEATKYRVQNILSLDLFLGKGRGEGSFNQALKFGGVTPMDERDAVRQATALASAGYKGKQLDAIMGALGDIHATRGEFYRSNLEFHFLRLKNEAKPDARDVKMAAIDTGVGMGGIMAQLYKARGKALPKDMFGADGEITTKAMHEMEGKYEEWKKAGTIAGNDVANAILRAIADKYDKEYGGLLGGAAKKLGQNSLAGLISNLEAAPERFLMQMKLENLPAIKSLMSFIQRLLPFFDHGTEQGKKLAAVVEKLANTLFGGLDKITEQDLARFFTSGLRVAEKLVVVVKKVWKFAEKLMHGTWEEALSGAGTVLKEVGKLLGTGIWEGFKAAMWGEKQAFSGPIALTATDRAGSSGHAALWSTLGQVPGAVGRAGRGVGAAFSAAGGAVANAFGGFGPAFRAVGEGLHLVDKSPLENVGADAVAGLEKGAREKGEIHSPSKLMGRVGDDLVEGLVEGVRRRAEQLRSGGPEVDPLLDGVIEALRGVAHRVGAPAT